jgi:hypothetical protein
MEEGLRKDSKGRRREGRRKAKDKGEDGREKG